jgi:alpha-beta hydrolase superfamily lysophospholipase
MSRSVFDELVPDVLGEPYLAETITLPPDDEGPVVATLVVRRAAEPTGKAVLHVHGFCDYFFHTAYAEWWNERGYDFYAVDLRKYGRSLRPHQTPNYVTDLRDHFPELDAAFLRVTARDGHDHVVMSAHSTGGLIVSLWANERRHGLAGMVLNSPWLDMQGGPLVRSLGTTIVKQLGAHQPARQIPRAVDGLYARSLHAEHDGEWSFNTEWKPLDSFPVSFGWLRAIRTGHEELHRGLEVGCPVLVLSSAGTRWPKVMGPDVHGYDVVLEVPQIRQWATAIGSHVSYVAIEGARHDVVLSLPEPREKAYAEIDRWRAAYVD